MGKVVMYSSVSVDGFVADENDQPGPLFDWLSSGDVPLDESGEVKVSHKARTRHRRSAARAEVLVRRTRSVGALASFAPLASPAHRERTPFPTACAS